MVRLDRELRRVVERALIEDGARRDKTTRLLLKDTFKERIRASVVAKESFLLCGLPLAQYAFGLLDEEAEFRFFCKDGERVSSGTVILEVKATAKAVLGVERVALNFIQLASAVATKTADFVEAVRGTGVRIYDTRKTFPGLRAVQRYAVRIGGGRNHRFNLRSAPLVKDNHWQLLLKRASDAERMYDDAVVLFKRLLKETEVEVGTVAEMEAAIKAGFQTIMLDNFSVAQLKVAVELARRLGAQLRKKIILEASGGITLKNVRSVAETGVDRISIGELTHTVEVPDVALKVIDYA